METLLEKARKNTPLTSNKTVTSEDIELALAWVRGEINNKQASSVYSKKDTTAFLYKMAATLRQANLMGIIEIKRIKNG